MTKPRWIVALVAVLVLVGFGSDKPAEENGGDPPTSAETHTSSRPEAIAFDGTHQHADGIEVAVANIAAAELVEFQAREEQAGITGDPYTILIVRVSNGSEEPLEPLADCDPRVRTR